MAGEDDRQEQAGEGEEERVETQPPGGVPGGAAGWGEPEEHQGTAPMSTDGLPADDTAFPAPSKSNDGVASAASPPDPFAATLEQIYKFSPVYRAGADRLVIELRVLDLPQTYGRPQTLSGFFDFAVLDGRKALVKAVESLLIQPSNRQPRTADQQPTGIYITLNPLDPALMARANNRLKPVGKGTLSATDKDVIARRWLVGRRGRALAALHTGLLPDQLAGGDLLGGHGFVSSGLLLPAGRRCRRRGRLGGAPPDLVGGDGPRVVPDRDHDRRGGRVEQAIAPDLLPGGEEQPERGRQEPDPDHQLRRVHRRLPGPRA
jgi:hypothetical protein